MLIHKGLLSVVATGLVMASKEEVIKALEECVDPELGISIVDLGLVYDVSVNNGNVKVKMTLTVRGCPLYGFFIEEIKGKLSKLEDVKSVDVEVVWDPPWTPDRLSPRARKLLNLP